MGFPDDAVPDSNLRAFKNCNSSAVISTACVSTVNPQVCDCNLRAACYAEYLRFSPALEGRKVFLHVAFFCEIHYLNYSEGIIKSSGTACVNLYVLADLDGFRNDESCCPVVIVPAVKLFFVAVQSTAPVFRNVDDIAGLHDLSEQFTERSYSRRTSSMIDIIVSSLILHVILCIGDDNILCLRDRRNREHCRTQHEECCKNSPV